MNSSNTETLLNQLRSGSAAPEIYDHQLHAAVAADNLDALSIRRTDAWAAALHAQQKRGDGAPYIIHPRRVALLFREANQIPEALSDGLQAALLLDVIEDCGVSRDQVAERCGDHVAELVELLSTDPRGEQETPAERRDRKERKWRRLQCAEETAVLLHLSDVLDNLISCRFLTPEMSDWRKVPRWLAQTLDWHIPMARYHSTYFARELLEEIRFEQARGNEPDRDSRA